MTTNFPTAKDQLQDGVDIIYADNVNSLQDKVGIDNSLDTSSIDYLLKNTNSLDPGHQHTLDTISETATKKVMTATERTKLQGIEDNADVTDATNVANAGATMDSDTSLAGNGYFLDEDNMSSNDDTKVPSQQSVKAYVDSAVAGLLDDRGNYDASGNVFPSSGGSGSGGAILKGDIWVISVAGTLGSQIVEIGDQLRAITDTPGQTESNWAISQANIGYVPENVANKATSTSLGTSDTSYPSQNAVKTYVDTKTDVADTTGTTVEFIRPQKYGTVASPETGNISNNLTSARQGVIQKIYHNNATEPTYPAGWVKISPTVYIGGVLNIIYCEWVSGTRVEYWITQES